MRQGTEDFRARPRGTKSLLWGTASALLPLLALATVSSTPAVADESGVSFWLPGLYGSLAALPAQPGFSFTTFNYFTDVSANKSLDFQIGARVVAGVDAHVELQAFNGTYVFANPVLGGQASVGMMSVVGRNDTSIFGTLSGPFGNTISGGRSQGVTGFGDLYPVGTLRWNWGVNNIMTYVTGDIPVGLYSAQNLANIGLGHAAIDAGGGYTYFNPQTGNEFSTVVGTTYNFENPSTNYQSGVDGHLDWGASHFFTQGFSLGAVGYVYQQLSADSGSGDRVGPFMSRVMGVGPQATLLFPIAGMQGYLNFKAYSEFNAQNRPAGYNTWLTFQISPAPQQHMAAATDMH